MGERGGGGGGATQPVNPDGRGMSKVKVRNRQVLHLYRRYHASTTRDTHGWLRDAGCMRFCIVAWVGIVLLSAHHRLHKGRHPKVNTVYTRVSPPPWHALLNHAAESPCEEVTRGVAPLLLALLGRRPLLCVRLALVARFGGSSGRLFGLHSKEAVQAALLFGLQHLGELGGSCADSVFAGCVSTCS